jgi:hypothetical protein
MPNLLDWCPLPAGVHDAIISKVSLHFGGATFVTLSYQVRHDGKDYCVHELLTFDAPIGSPQHQRSAEGKGRVKQILQAHGRSESEIQDYDDVERVLCGLRVKIHTVLRNQNGLPVPRVLEFLGKGEEPVIGDTTTC